MHSIANNRLPRAALALPAEVLAPRLLGSSLVRVLPDGTRLAGRIVEAEAYLGVRDRCCHSFAVRHTPRNHSMYLPAGTAYVYFTYGMHFCFNVVCGDPDEPVAVLIRALEPLEGLPTMRRHRAAPGRPTPRDTDLCSGPGKLCQALALSREDDSLDLTTSNTLFLIQGSPPERIVLAPRVGVGDASPWARRRLRWYERGNPHVSVRAKAERLWSPPPRLPT
jgi:DNA-3-methyladenine glycosylase